VRHVERCIGGMETKKEVKWWSLGCPNQVPPCDDGYAARGLGMMETGQGQQRTGASFACLIDVKPLWDNKRRVCMGGRVIFLGSVRTKVPTCVTTHSDLGG